MLFVLWLTVRLLTRLVVLPNADDDTKDLEILVLRHQLRVLRRKTGRPRFTVANRVLLAAASLALPRQRWASSFLVSPQTLLRWHRTLVRRKWTYGKERTPGRPPIDPQTAALILRMPRDNSRWGCGADLRRAAQARHPGGFHNHQDTAATTRPRPSAATHRADVDAVSSSAGRGDRGLRLLYGGNHPAQDVVCAVLHSPQHQAGRLAGVTANPDSAWVTQHARNAAMDLNDRGVSVRMLLHDHDAEFTRSFDEVFCSEGAKVIRTPIQAPKANAYAERWVQTVRAECLDWTLVLGRRHLLWLLCGYVGHYNQQRPHRGLAMAVPEAGERG
jgi:putative transposase